MSDISDLYKKVENASYTELMIAITDGITAIIPKLRNTGIKDSFKFITGYLFTIVSVDGKISVEEYTAIKPMLTVFYGDCTLEDAKQLLLKDGFDDKNIRADFSHIVNTLLSIDERLALELVSIAIMISALDGDVCRKERSFIQSLF